MKKILFGLLIILSFSACNREIYPPMGGPLPFPFSAFILIKENNLRLPDSALNRLYLVYFEGDQKRYISDFSRATNEFDSLGIMNTMDMGYISADKGIKDFYLEYANGDVDTIYADYRRFSREEAIKNNFSTEMPLLELKFNGKTAQPDTSIKVCRVYRFDK